MRSKESRAGGDGGGDGTGGEVLVQHSTLESVSSMFSLLVVMIRRRFYQVVVVE